MSLMNAWASTLPYPPKDGRQPAAGSPCPVADCPEPLRSNEEVYRVIEMPGDEWICWRHVARENGGPYPVTTGGDD